MNALLEDKRNVYSADKLGPAVLGLVEENLRIMSKGFSLTFTNFAKKSNLVAIYDSEWCRVSFTLSLQQSPQHDEMTVEYGRLHAVNDKPFMEWQGRLCHSWHYVFVPLRFLDGLSPSEAVHQVNIKKETPMVVENFRKSELGKKLMDEYSPKAVIVMHSIIWSHYGQRIFDLFDLRKPKIWDEYRKFIREYYKLLNMKVSFGPPYENIC